MSDTITAERSPRTRRSAPPVIEAEAVRAAREIATLPDDHFRVPENVLAEKRSLETRLKSAHTRLVTLNRNMAKAQWEAIAVIVDTIRFGLRHPDMRLDLGRDSMQQSRRSNVEISADYLFDYVFQAGTFTDDFLPPADRKSPFGSEIMGLINYAVREDIPDVYEWLAGNGGRSATYRIFVAKRQENPRRTTANKGSASSGVASEAPPIAQAETVIAAVLDATAIPKRWTPAGMIDFPEWPAGKPHHLIPPDDLAYEADHDCELAHVYLTELMAIAFDPKEPESTRLVAYRRLFEFVAENWLYGGEANRMADIFVMLNQRQLYADLQVAREHELAEVDAD